MQAEYENSVEIPKIYTRESSILRHFYPMKLEKFPGNRRSSFLVILQKLWKNFISEYLWLSASIDAVKILSNISSPLLNYSGA